jgi:hypothetical protein
MSQLATFLIERFPNDNSAKHFGDLLEAYRESGLAPPNLIQEVTSGDDGKFWAHVWEAMLFRHFSSLGLELVRGKVTKAGQIGPDFGFVVGTTTVWVEANVPAPIDIPDEWVRSPKAGELLLREKPSDRMLLRWIFAVERKTEILERYLRQGIVGANDCLVIAVNSCRLADFDPDDSGSSQLPFAIEAVFPVGPLGVPLMSDGQVAGPTKRIPRFAIKDQKQSEIATDKFLNPTFAPISAVVGSNSRHMLDGSLLMVIVHNPLATNPLPRGALGKCTEYFAEKDGEGYLLRANLNDNL